MRGFEGNAFLTVVLLVLIFWGTGAFARKQAASADDRYMLPQINIEIPPVYSPDFNSVFNPSTNNCDWRKSGCGCSGGGARPTLNLPPVTPHTPNIQAPTFGQMPHIQIHKEPKNTGHSLQFMYPVQNLDGIGMNDRTRSITVHSGTWEVCEHAGYGGVCRTLGPGVYPDLASLGYLYKRISSMRPV